MIKDSDYKRVLDAIASPILIAFPLYDQSKNEIKDFEIEYLNEALSNLTQNLFSVHMKLSECIKDLSETVHWLQIGVECFLTKRSVEKSFYSNLGSCWIRIVVNSMLDGYICLTVSDISKDKENEQKLRNQNMRLAALTDELSTSRNDLKKKFNNIQTLNDQLQFAAYHDTLTNLYNRAWYNKCIASAIDKAARNRGKFGLVIIDIDGIKAVNDSQGLKAGDELLRKAAATLRRLESDTCKAFRFGGDEFIMLNESIVSRMDMKILADTMLSQFKAAGLSISGGISVYPDDSDKAEDLLKYSDMAKSEVKVSGKGRIEFFEKVMKEKFLQKMNIENKLSKAMDSNVFQLYFQPQFDVASGLLRGFEALIRWYDDDLGWISPEKFIPLAEESRLVIPLGDWVIDTALKTLKEWEDKYSFDGIISVNVSPLQLRRSDFIDELIKKVNCYGVDVRHLELEITEGMLIENLQETVEKLKQIRDMGMGISLDDFGTGYSSLRYLQILPLTTLKIDKSFISNISAKDGVEADITESIVSLVSKLGLDTIAEGVETPAQLDMLKKFNCHNVQGFLKGKPMPVDLCERMLKGDTSAVLTINNNTPESL